MEQGYIALVLHAHLPYVRHRESGQYLEERWLFEAITETYIPLLQVFQRLVREHVDFHVTLSLSPTLVSMLIDPFLQDRYLTHLQKLIELAEKEVIRTAAGTDASERHELADAAMSAQKLARYYADKFTTIRDFYSQSGQNLISAFRELQELGKLELITSAATHAFLPLVQTEEAMRAQLQMALDLHEQHFGERPRGVWLPECGYVPALDPILRELGIDYFFVDAHGLQNAEPAPVFGTLSPVLTPCGVAAFARDRESSKQVWSSQEGYPGDFDYREYYRDIGYDLDLETIQPYIHPAGIRVNTGIKYYRITGQGAAKELYDPQRASDKAAMHAGNFMFNRQKQVEHGKWQIGRKPLIVAPYDAELFGHWWYEGPIWIEMLLRKIHFDQDTLKTITPSEYLRLYSDYQVCRLSMSTWGRDGYADVWLRSENDWIYPALHMAERRMIDLANRFCQPTRLEERALKQAARELMLAQSSDWAFIMDTKTMVDYAVKRTKQHINRFTRLYEMLTTGKVADAWLTELEQLNPIFPEVDYRLYQSRHAVARLDSVAAKPRVLLLSWEFPPMTVGGLARHVYDLSRALVQQGWDVHVLTTEVQGYPHTETVAGVQVHRVHVLQPDGGEFVHWAFQLNLMLIDACRMLIDAGLTFDLIHAHDWLVSYAARTLKELYGLPLIATIHATEHGRNQGIHTDLQRYIHNLEWKLIYEAQQVIVCSTYMQREVETVFQLPTEKISVLPNGVDPDLLQPPAPPVAGESNNLRTKEPFALDSERIVLFIGRLVREKGVHILLEAAPAILAKHPDVKFVIAGKGPILADLQRQAEQLGISQKVLFAGFVSDEERNRLYQLADVAVFPSLYEPFGIVALEAMAAGTPVVVSDVGGLTDVVEHRWNGLKAYAGDLNSLAIQVNQLLQEQTEARRMAQTALREIDKYDWKQIAQQTIELYERITIKQSAENGVQQIAVSLEHVPATCQSK